MGQAPWAGLPTLSGLGLWAVAAGRPRGAARLTADLQGRVLATGHLAGAEGHRGVELGLEQLELLQCLHRLGGDLGHASQKVVVLTRVLRQVKEQRGLVGSQRVRGVAGGVRCGVTVDGAWRGGARLGEGQEGLGSGAARRSAGLGERKLPWVKK